MGLAGVSSSIALALLAAATAAPARCEESAPPRLAGIAVGLGARVAVFDDPADGGRTITLTEGEEIGDFAIEIIDPRFVVVVGPSGVEKWTPQEGPGRPNPSDSGGDAPSGLSRLRIDTTNAGASIGQLAIQRDNCARTGFLPRVAADAEARLKRLIDAMPKLPARQGDDAAHDAPTKLLASALAAGLEVARLRVLAGEFNSAGCLDLDMRWKRSAGRYGLL